MTCVIFQAGIYLGVGFNHNARRMHYLLFVGFNTGLMHNALHTTLKAARESVEQLIEDESAKLESGKLPSMSKLKKRLNEYDDYTGVLSNGTWFHIQPKNVFEIIK